MPNGDSIRSTGAVALNIPNLPASATSGHIVPGLSSSSLLSIGKLCDAGCVATFSKHNLKILHNNKPILNGTRTPNGLWTVPFPKHHCLLAREDSVPSLIAFYHATAGYPAQQTWCAAIDKGFFVSWPGLSSAAVRRHLPKSTITDAGHLDQQRQGIRSTTKSPRSRQKREPRHEYITASVAEFTGRVHGDLCGRFPITSSRGNQYHLVLYCEDSNAILVEPIASRESTAIMKGYKNAHERLTRAGFQPRLQRLDNETSTALKDFFDNTGVDFQLAPPHMHRQNAAERAIRTWKNHFISVLAGTDRAFPMHLWDRLIPQAEACLNMLRASSINPNISAHDQIFGPFNWNQTPLAPLGCKVTVHEKPSQRKLWAPHGITGFYIGPAKNHYRCYRAWIPATRKERISDTISFHPEHVQLPQNATEEDACRVADKLVSVLTRKTNSPAVTPTTIEALTNLARIFRDISRPKPDPNHTQTNTPAPVVPPVPRVTTPPPKPSTPCQPAPTTEKQPAPPPTPQVPRVQKRNHQTSDPYRRTYKPRIRNLPAVTQSQPTQPDFVGAVIDETTGREVPYRKLISTHKDSARWQIGACKEFGRLAQGFKKYGVEGTNTIFFKRPSELPQGRTATYARFVCSIRPQKSDPIRVRCTAGGDKVDYPGDCSTKTTAMTTAKLLINSVLSSRNSRFCALDIKNFYLGTPMPWRYEYMRVALRDIPPEFIAAYALEDIAEHGSVLLEIRRGMYGLPHAGRIANDQLVNHLAKFGYRPTARTHGLWRHDTRDIKFCLCVDDFGVAYSNKQDVLHLLSALDELYEETTVDWTGETFLGMSIKWDYDARKASISMPGFVDKILAKAQHAPPKKPNHSPHHWNRPTFGKNLQLTPAHDSSPKLDKAKTTRYQMILGSLLFYARAVDPTILVALGTLASSQASPTEESERHLHFLLDYVASHPNSTITFGASDMKLRLHSDASYLSEPQARSRAGGHFFFGHEEDRNSPVHTVSIILRNVVASAAEAEFAAIFHNAQEAEALRTALSEMGHPQGPTPIQVDNICAVGLANDTVKQRRSKAIDMRYYWVRDRIQQKHFHVFWKPGSTNLADYFTKHFPATHHQNMRPLFVAAHCDSTSDCEGVLSPGHPGPIGRTVGRLSSAIN